MAILRIKAALARPSAEEVEETRNQQARLVAESTALRAPASTRCPIRRSRHDAQRRLDLASVQFGRVLGVVPVARPEPEAQPVPPAARDDV